MGALARLRRLFRRAAPTPEPRGLPAPEVAPPADPMAAAALRLMTQAAEANDAAGTIAKAALTAGAVTDAVGVPGFAVYGGRLQETERNGAMVGSRKWTRFAELARTSHIGAPLRRYLTLAGAPGWTVPAYQVDKDTPPDEDALMMAAFAEAQLANLATEWPRVVMTGALSRWNGAEIQTWTARRLPDGMVGLDDIASRPMHTIEEWIYVDGKLTGVRQRDPAGGALLDIPRERMVFSRDVPITDSPAGVGIFRQVAEPVRELEALFQLLHQGLETDLGGIPVIYAPLDALSRLIGQKVGDRVFARADFDAAVAKLINFAKNHIKTKETGLVFDSGAHKGVDGASSGPPLYKVELLQAGAQSHGALLEAIKAKLWEIAVVTGFEYLMLGADGSGSLAMAEVKTNDAYRLVTSFLNAYAITIQRDVLRPLWALNGRDPMTAPLPVWDRLEFQDAVKTLGGLLNPLSVAGITIGRDDAIVNEAIARAGFSPLAAQVDPGLDIIPARAEAARRAGLDGANPDAAPDGVIDPVAVVKRRPPIVFDEED